MAYWIYLKYLRIYLQNSRKSNIEVVWYNYEMRTKIKREIKQIGLDVVIVIVVIVFVFGFLIGRIM